MGTFLRLVMESNGYLPGDGFFVDSRSGAEIQAVDGGPPFSVPESFLYLVGKGDFGVGVTASRLLRVRLGGEVEGFGYLERDVRDGRRAGGGGPDFWLAWSRSTIEDLRASLPDIMLERALESLTRAVPTPPSSALQEALMQLLAVSISAFAAARKESCPWRCSNILLGSNLGNLKEGAELPPGESCRLPREGSRGR